jgi:hypothetical protein
MDRLAVWKCHFDDIEKPFAVKVVKMLLSSDIEAPSRKRFCNDVDVYITLEKAYQSGQLEDRFAPRCYGAFKGKDIDSLLSSTYTTLFSIREIT